LETINTWFVGPEIQKKGFSEGAVKTERLGFGGELQGRDDGEGLIR